MITQNWNTRTSEIKIVECSDDGQKIEVNGGETVHKGKKYFLNNIYEVPRKLVGNFRPIICIGNHQEVNVEGLPRYIFVSKGKVIGISKEFAPDWRIARKAY